MALKCVWYHKDFPHGLNCRELIAPFLLKYIICSLYRGLHKCCDQCSKYQFSWRLFVEAVLFCHPEGIYKSTIQMIRVFVLSGTEIKSQLKAFNWWLLLDVIVSSIKNSL